MLYRGPMTGEGAIAGGGRLACVGIGMMLGAHLSPRARQSIAQADVVFAAVSDPLVELWLERINPATRSLQPHYAEGKPRQQTYREMVEAMLAEVRAGRRVCGAFYGHPGVFAWAPHAAIEMARAEGYPAHMEPGISAEDCLYADLGIDPGRVGCQHFEASQLLLFQRRIDPSAMLVLWQVGVTGDRSYARFGTDPARLALLVERLREDYPADHEVILYVAATLPIATPSIRRLTLAELPEAAPGIETTLVVPPAAAPRPDTAMRARLAALDAATLPRNTPATQPMQKDVAHVEGD